MSSAVSTEGGIGNSRHRRLCLPGRSYIGDRSDTTQQSGQTPDKEVDINHISVYVSGYTETDTTGMLSPNNGRLCVANKVDLFRADSLARYLLQCA
jgi:hypothetical protein